MIDRDSSVSRIASNIDTIIHYEFENRSLKNSRLGYGECVIFGHAPNTKEERGIRECRRRERRKFGRFCFKFNTEIEEIQPLVFETDSFWKRARITCGRMRDFPARRQNRREKAFASAEGASGENVGDFLSSLTRKLKRLNHVSTKQAVF